MQASRLPALQQTVEHGSKTAAFQLGVQGVDMVAPVGAQAQKVIGHIVFIQAVHADQLVKRRQGGWQLGNGKCAPLHHRQKGTGAPTVRSQGEAEFLLQQIGRVVHLPAGGAVHLRGAAEDVAIAVGSELQLTAGPVGIFAHHVVLPEDVIPGVHAGFMAGAVGVSHGICGASADVRAGQQCAVQQGFQAIVAGHRCALNLGEEAGAKHPLERAPGVIWPEAE